MAQNREDFRLPKDWASSKQLEDFTVLTCPASGYAHRLPIQNVLEVEGLPLRPSL